MTDATSAGPPGEERAGPATGRPHITDSGHSIDLEIGRSLAHAGVPIFVAPPDKSTSTGYRLPVRWQHTKPDPAVVDQWRPGWALCAVTGHLLDLVDVDPRNGGDRSERELRAAGLWPRAYAQAATPSGGRHDFVQVLGVHSRDNFRPGIDIKAGLAGDGHGFAFIPPTVRKSKVTGEPVAYRWLTPPDLDALDGGDTSGEALADVVEQMHSTGNVHKTGWTDPDLGELIEHGTPAGQSQDSALRDVVWKLRAKQYERSVAKLVWNAIVAKTTLTRPGEPWTGKDFDRHWAGADRKIEDPPPTSTIGDNTKDQSRPSWSPVDLAPILDGTRPRLQATILTRTDGQGLWYPGRTHALVGESEAAKSWIAQYACAQQLLAGHAVIYLDFEDSAEAVTDRMLILGMTAGSLRALFGYIAPEEPIDPAGRGPLSQALGDLRPTLVLIDGVTEAMSLHKLKSVDNDDLATFGRLITRPIAATGAATVNLDHQPKATDNRGRYALGGVHKLNGLTGVSIIAENIAPMGVGLRGVTRLRIAKDRPGQLRAHGLPSAGLRWIGDFILDTSILEEPALIRPPVEVAKAAEDWRPTEVMRKVCDAMTKAGKPLPATGIYDRVKARANITRRALAILVDEKYIEERTGPHGARLHTLIKPYEGDTDE